MILYITKNLSIKEKLFKMLNSHINNHKMIIINIVIYQILLVKIIIKTHIIQKIKILSLTVLIHKFKIVSFLNNLFKNVHKIMWIYVKIKNNKLVHY
jgi:hypothetical protein